MKRLKTIRVRGKRPRVRRVRGKKVRTRKVTTSRRPKFNDKWHKE